MGQALPVEAGADKEYGETGVEALAGNTEVAEPDAADEMTGEAGVEALADRSEVDPGEATVGITAEAVADGCATAEVNVDAAAVSAEHPP